MIEDSYIHKGLRQKLVSKLRQKGIKNEAVLSAIGKVPRHVFFDGALISHAYEDKAFPIGEGQTISQPFTVAFQTEKLNIAPGNKVLEIGTGSGYHAALCAEIVAPKDSKKPGHVFTIERHKELVEKAKKALKNFLEL